MSTNDCKWLNLPSLGLPVKVLFTGYLLAVGVGLAMAGLQIVLTHGMADGKLGLSIDDIVYSYYGDRGNSKLEAKLNGSMKNNAPDEIRSEIIHWARDGAPKDVWNTRMANVFDANCNNCHAHIDTIPAFTDYATVKDLAKTDEGVSVSALTRVSHIHLFGIGFIFFFIGFIFSFSVGIPKILKMAAIAAPFAFLILDIFSWWVTKWIPGFAWFTIIGGIGYSIASTFMWFTSMYQMWILPWRGEKYEVNTWVE